MKDEFKRNLDALFPEGGAAPDGVGTMPPLPPGFSTPQGADSLENQFIDKAEKIIRPALVEISSHLVFKGGQYAVRLDQSAPITVALQYAGSGSTIGGIPIDKRPPEFVVQFDKAARNVVFRGSTPLSDGELGRIGVDEVTTDEIQQRAIAYLADLKEDLKSLSGAD